MKLEIHKLKIDVYDDMIILVIGTNKQISKYVKRKYKIDIDDEFYAEHQRFGDKGNSFLSLIMMCDKDIDSLSHECLHAAIWILNDRGIKINIDNSEPLTYLHEYIFKNLRKRMLKNKHHTKR